MLTLGTDWTDVESFRGAQAPDEGDGLGSQQSDDIMVYGSGTFSAIHPVVGDNEIRDRSTVH